MKRRNLKTAALATLLCAGLPALVGAYEVPWSEKNYQAAPGVSEYNELGWLVGGDSKIPDNIMVPSELTANYVGARSNGTAYAKANDTTLIAKSSAVERTAKYTLDANSSAAFQGYYYGTNDILKLNYSYTSDGTSLLWYLVTDLYEGSILYNVTFPTGSGTVKLPVPSGHQVATNLQVASFSLATNGSEKISSSTATFSYELVAPTSDNDEDGVPNETDQCPGTPLGSFVDPANGCSIDELVPCSGPRGTGNAWKNHGEYVSSYANTVARVDALGLIPPGEKAGLVKAASMSKCGAE